MKGHMRWSYSHEDDRHSEEATLRAAASVVFSCFLWAGAAYAAVTPASVLGDNHSYDQAVTRCQGPLYRPVVKTTPSVTPPPFLPSTVHSRQSEVPRPTPSKYEDPLSGGTKNLQEGWARAGLRFKRLLDR